MWKEAKAQLELERNECLKYDSSFSRMVPKNVNRSVITNIVLCVFIHYMFQENCLAWLNLYIYYLIFIFYICYIWISFSFFYVWYIWKFDKELYNCWRYAHWNVLKVSWKNPVLHLLVTLTDSSIFYKSCWQMNVKFKQSKSGGLPVLPKLFPATIILLFVIRFEKYIQYSLYKT